MDTTPLMIAHLINIGFLVGWPLLSLFALVGLRRRPMSSTAKALWAGIILIVPFLGALAFWLVKPTDEGITP